MEHSQNSMKIPPWKRRLYRGLLLIIAMIMTIAVVELALYLPRPRHIMDNPWYLSTGHALTNSADLIFERPPYIDWTGSSRGDLAMRPGDRDPYARKVTFQTDYQGFRNSKDMEKADIVFLGDSFTEAGNVNEEETFVQLAARRLGLSARNLGRAGYGAQSELVVLRKYALACEPRIVVWQIAEANDVVESEKFVNWVAAGKPDPISDPSQLPSRADAWKARSPSYRLYKELSGSDTEWPLEAVFTDSDYERHTYRFLSLPNAGFTSDYPGYIHFSTAMEEGLQLLKSRNIHAVVLVIPSKIRAMRESVEFTAATRAMLPLGWGVPPDATIAAATEPIARKYGFSFIDCLPPLRTASNSGRMVYLPLDTHLSPEGHALIANLVCQSIGQWQTER